MISHMGWLYLMSSEPNQFDAITNFPRPFQMDLGPLHLLSLEILTLKRRFLFTIR